MITALRCYPWRMPQSPREREVWTALRRTQRKLHESRSQSISFGKNGASSRSERKQLFSGYSPADARAALLAASWDAAEADSALKQSILQRFTTFAGSWNGYIAGHGFMYELDQLPAEVQAEYEARYQLSAVRAATDDLTAAGPMALADPAKLSRTVQQLNALQHSAAFGDVGQHPAIPALVGRHGMPPALAEAVVLFQRAVPGWVIALIFFFATLAGLVFVAALVNPQSPSFQNEDVGGVGAGQLVAAPLFSLIFYAMAIWLWRDSPRRNAEWKAALERYRAAG